MHTPIQYLRYAKWWLKPTVVGCFFREAEGEISKRFIARFIPADPVIIDAGAHTGQDSMEMARLWPGAAIHAFEPVPSVFAKLKRNTRSYRNIRSYEMALGDAEGEAEMFLSSGQDASSSLLEPRGLLNEHPEIKFNEKKRVRVNTIEQWAKENQIGQIDFMWLDMQGYEMKAIQGTGALLDRVSAIHTEVHLNETYSGAGLYSNLRPWMETRGFRVEREEIPWESMGNVLFVRAGTHARVDPV